MVDRGPNRFHQIDVVLVLLLPLLVTLAPAKAEELASGCNPTRTAQVPPGGVSSNAVVQRATFKTKAANCQSCPAGSETEPGIFDCTCHQTTIPQLKASGLDKAIRFNIRYATLNAGTPATTKNLIVAFAGQNGVSAGSVSGGGPGNLTGQPDHWSDGCTTPTVAARCSIAVPWPDVCYSSPDAPIPMHWYSSIINMIGDAGIAKMSRSPTASPTI
jgi:hypothetical protein